MIWVSVLIYFNKKRKVLKKKEVGKKSQVFIYTAICFGGAYKVNKDSLCASHSGGGHLDGLAGSTPFIGDQTGYFSSAGTRVAAVNTITDNAVMSPFCDMPKNGGSLL